MNPQENQNPLLGKVPFEELWDRSADGDKDATDEMARRCKEYWKKKEQLTVVMEGLEAFSDFLDDLNSAMRRLRMKLQNPLNPE